MLRHGPLRAEGSVMPFVHDPTRIPSDSPAAVRKRKQREKLRAKEIAVADERAERVVMHTTQPLRVTTAPEKFSSVPEAISNLVADPEQGETDAKTETPNAEPDGGAPASGSAPVQAPIPDGVTPEEAAIIGQLVGGFITIGTAQVLDKHPQAAAAILQTVIVTARQAGKELTPPQALAAYGQFMGAAAARLSIKYNFRFPWFDESAVAVGIGIAAYGFVPAKKDKTKKPPKDANPKNDNAPEPVSTQQAEVDIEAEIPDLTNGAPS